MHVQLRTRDSEVVVAQLCPAWFLDSDLEENEEIAVFGRFTNSNGLTVREMVRATVRYTVRDEEYEPLWLRTRLEQRNRFYDPRTERRMKCRIDEIYIDEPSSMMEAQVRNENGERVRVRFAPEWFLRKRLRLGDEVELRGSAVGPESDVMILAREMRNSRTREETKLRSREGFPMWRRNGGENRERRGGHMGKKEGRGKQEGHGQD